MLVLNLVVSYLMTHDTNVIHTHRDTHTHTRKYTIIREGGRGKERERLHKRFSCLGVSTLNIVNAVGDLDSVVLSEYEGSLRVEIH
jgi:hypothetical protein